jgi:haloalkane dehalogenase
VKETIMTSRSHVITPMTTRVQSASRAADESAVPAWLDRDAYPFAHHGIDLENGRMHYVDEGAGSPVLLIHGTPTWSFEYRHVIAALAPRARVVAPDHLGFGLSARPRDFAYTPEAHSDNLIELVDRLDLRDVTLVVHDFGGPIGLRLALDRPDRIARIVIINSWLWPFDDDAVMAKRAKMAGGPIGRFLYKYFNASLRLIMPSAYGNRSALTKQIHRQYLEVFRERDARVRVLHRLAVSLLGSSAYYARLHARMEELRSKPALVVWGLKDSAFQPYQLDRWRRELPAAGVVTIDDAGHWPHEEAPEAVIAAVARFTGLDRR